MSIILLEGNNYHGSRTKLGKKIPANGSPTHHVAQWDEGLRASYRVHFQEVSRHIPVFAECHDAAYLSDAPGQSRLSKVTGQVSNSERVIH